jgi:cytosine/adenosine deaminase-related metal-dependent hydrolase
MLIIGNGRMVTRDANKPYLEDGAVAIDGQVISKIGTTAELKKLFPQAEFVDAKGGVIMPAFINTHEHIYSAMARGLSVRGYNPKGFLDILDGMWWTIDRNLSLEQTRQSARATYIESIKNGVTTVFDHHASFGDITGSLFAIEDAARQVPELLTGLAALDGAVGELSVKSPTLESVFLKITGRALRD